MNIKAYDNGSDREARYTIFITDKRISFSSGKTPDSHWSKQENVQMIIGNEIPLLKLPLDVRSRVFAELKQLQTS